jgi:hypothetical protein
MTFHGRATDNLSRREFALVFGPSCQRFSASTQVLYACPAACAINHVASLGKLSAVAPRTHCDRSRSCRGSPSAERDAYVLPMQTRSSPAHDRQMLGRSSLPVCSAAPEGRLAVPQVD